MVSSPLDPESIAVVEPMGRMAASHVTPTDHLYISNNDPWRADSSFVVRAPADGHIVLIQRFPSDQVSHLDPTVTREDYLMVIAHTCTFFTMYIHTAALAPEVAAVTGEIGHGESWYAHRAAPIPVMAGQAVADYPGFSLDLLTIDTHVTLSGFAVPEHYAGEPWKVHTVDPFDYYVEPARSQLLARNPRTVEPLGGKIDYDVDGKAVGNWFLDGTVDYRGGPDAGPEYWSGHLTIAYDHIDPAQVRISVGRDVGITSDACWICDRVFGVRGNGPDPGTIDTSSGLVKYELVSLEHVMAYNADGEPLGTNVAFSSNDSAPLGAALVQMLDDRTLRFEIVPAVPPSTVSDFSDHAAVYRR